MRRAAVDVNQSEIVADLREYGFSVQPLHTVGKGVPDLLIGKYGKNWLMEIKDGAKPPSKRRLTDDQIEWHTKWRGHVVVIESRDAAYRWAGLIIAKNKNVRIEEEKC